jgi:hypothetical protein
VTGPLESGGSCGSVSKRHCQGSGCARPEQDSALDLRLAGSVSMHAQQPLSQCAIVGTIGIDGESDSRGSRNSKRHGQRSEYSGCRDRSVSRRWWCLPCLMPST